MSEIGFVASNVAGLESRPPQITEGPNGSASESSSRENIVSTPVQFIQAYNLKESVVIDNTYKMFSGTEAHFSKTGLEQWILLAHKMKDIVKDKEKQIASEKNKVNETEKRWQEDIQI